MAKLKAKVDKKNTGKEKDELLKEATNNTDSDVEKEEVSEDHTVGKKGGRGKKVIETEAGSEETEVVKKENEDETEENTADDEPAVVNGSAKTHGGSKTGANGEESSDANEAPKGRKRAAKTAAARTKKSKTDSENAAEEPESEDAAADDKSQTVNSTSNKRGKQNRKTATKQTKENSDDAEADYEVEEILEMRTGEDGNKEFLVKWKGYKKSESTWEPEDHLSCKDLIAAFNKKTELTANPTAGRKRASKSSATPKGKKAKPESKQNSRAASKSGRSKSVQKSTKDQKKSEKEYEVADILEMRTDESGNKEFLVNWKGYKKSDSTWEPENNLSCKNLIEAFHKRTEAAASPAAGKKRASQSPAPKKVAKKTKGSPKVAAAAAKRRTKKK